MDRVVAYRLLAQEVDALRQAGHARLFPRIGQRQERWVTVEGAEYLVDTEVLTWPPEGPGILARVVVASPSTFRFDSVQDAIVLDPDDGTRPRA